MICSQCSLDKDEAEFYYYKSKDFVSKQCDTCRRNGNRVRALKTRYNLTIEEYDEMLKAQSGLCYICKKPEARVHNSTGVVTRLCVDHNHETGRVRALLCKQCNWLVGYFEQEPDMVWDLMDYLNTFK